MTVFQEVEIESLERFLESWNVVVIPNILFIDFLLLYDDNEIFVKNLIRNCLFPGAFAFTKNIVRHF